MIVTYYPTKRAKLPPLVWTVKALKDLTYRQRPHRPGVYILGSPLQVLYVGQTADLRDRFGSYIRNPEGATWIAWTEVEERLNRLHLETALIEALRPARNKRRQTYH